MGSHPAPEHMLITLWNAAPTAEIAAIRRAFPYIEVTYYEVSAVNNFVDNAEVGKQVPNELWAKATILVTLFALPNPPELAPNLRYVHLTSAGIDHFARHPLITHPPHPLTITTVAGIAAPPIAEHVAMTLLALTKVLPTQLRWQAAHRWGTKPPFMARMGDWVGKTVGILGYGSIGRHTARVLVALGTRVHAYTARERRTDDDKRDTQYRLPGTGDPDGIWPARWFHGTDTAQLHEFLGSGLHALVVCLPLTDQTRGLLGEREFAVLRDTSPFRENADEDVPGGYVINIARGPILDQDALVCALKDNVVRGAALDVTDPEPLPEDSELWDMPNVIITPHVSALGREYLPRVYEVLRENLARRERGEKMWNVVPVGRGY